MCMRDILFWCDAIQSPGATLFARMCMRLHVRACATGFRGCVVRHAAADGRRPRHTAAAVQVRFQCDAAQIVHDPQMCIFAHVWRMQNSCGEPSVKSSRPLQCTWDVVIWWSFSTEHGVRAINKSLSCTKRREYISLQAMLQVLLCVRVDTNRWHHQRNRHSTVTVNTIICFFIELGHHRNAEWKCHTNTHTKPYARDIPSLTNRWFLFNFCLLQITGTRDVAHVMNLALGYANANNGARDVECGT